MKNLIKLRDYYHEKIDAIDSNNGACSYPVLEEMDDGVVVVNAKGVIEVFNHAAEKIFGYTVDEMVGRCVSKLKLDIILNQYDGLFGWYEQKFKFLDWGGGKRISGLRKDGTCCLLKLKVFAIHIENDNCWSVILISDVTERREYEIAIRNISERNDQNFSELVSYLHAIDQRAIVSAADLSGRIIHANGNFCAISGYSLEELLGHDHRIVNSGKHPSAFFAEMWKVITRGETWHGEICNRAKDGTLYWVDSSIVPLKDVDGKIVRYLSVRVDITKRKESEHYIQTLAYYDSLTGLPNRTLLHDRLGQLIAESHRDRQKFALLYIDLDRFKYVNDSMGHAVGDKLLQIVALRLSECVREADTVSRISGDEFVIVLSGADAEGASHVARSILRRMSVPCDVGVLQFVTHASIGISIYPDDAGSEDEINTLIKHADVAMYRVKTEGRSNFLFFEPGMNFRAKQLFSMENDIRLALERSEFTLHYQPQVDLISGMVCGAEALLRWRHPEKGSISPAEFVPVAEETGQIVPIGEWVLRTACAQLAKWRQQGMPVFPISVNLSVSQLRQPHLAQLVIDILEETGLHPHDLELEITEGVMMNEAQATMAFLNRMHELGVQLAMDDFGTGYSSLSYLKKMPLDRLKVDQSFVRDVATDENDAAIVRSIISLGHQFKLQVIAEGVETVEQLDFLRAQNCDEIQGYYYSRPLPAKEFATFMNCSNPSLD